MYGYLFYPLYTLAGEQLLRVADSAIMFKCQLLGAPRQVSDFYKRLKWLAKQKIISPKQEHQWQKVRRFRNSASHPQDQMILPPGYYIDFLVYITEEINMLFDSMNKADGDPL